MSKKLVVRAEMEDSPPDALRREVLSVGKHSIIYVGGQALSRAVGFFMIPIYTRFIAPTNYGAMELIEILTAAIGMLISMGVTDTMSRFYYEEREQFRRNQVVSTVIMGFGLTGIPVVSLFLFFSSSFAKVIFEEPQYCYYLQVAIGAVWFSMLCEVGYTYLRMLYKARLFVAVTIAHLIVALSLNIYFVVFLKLDILGIFYSTLITQGLTGLILSGWILRRVGFRISPEILWQLIKFGLPVVPSRIGLMLGFVTNRFFLRWFSSPDPTVALAQIGLFALGHKFGVIINRFVNVPFNSFWSPRKMDLLLNEGPSARKTVARICTYATLCSTYLALILSCGIESVIEIVADPRYQGAHIVVPFVALSYVALGLETHFITGILYRKKTKWATYITLCSLFIVFAWNYLFVPRWGLIGAATSNLGGFVVRIVFTYSISQRLFHIPFEMKRLAIIFAVALVLFFTSQAMTFSSPYLTFLIRTCFVALFPLILALFKFYHQGEMEFAKSIVRKGFKFIEAYWPGFRQV